MSFEVTILGSSSATPIYNRNPSAQLLHCKDKFYLIDCGEGTQQQLNRFNLKASKIDYIFISHLHGDHYFGLIGLLSSMHLNGRVKPLQLFGPAALMEILELQFKHSETLVRYPIEFTAITADMSTVIFENGDLKVETIILNHRISCTGFKFTEQLRPRKLLVDKLETADVSIAYYPLLKKGLDLTLPDGTVYLNQDYTTDPIPPKSYAYCSDTLADGSYLEALGHCTVIYHEATFLQELLDRANVTHHSTAMQAAEVAKHVQATQLIIGHFSSRYKLLQPLLDEARTIFPNTVLAIEGQTYTVD
jgi:ribonuclease Z